MIKEKFLIIITIIISVILNKHCIWCVLHHYDFPMLPVQKATYQDHHKYMSDLMLCYNED